MGLIYLALIVFVAGGAYGLTYRVCIPASERSLCNSLDRDGQAICNSVESRVDCALRLARGEVDIGVFNEEETLLLGQVQPNDHRVVATIRDVARTEPYAFEAVAIVSSAHTDGLTGLRNAKYCHPGLDQQDLRWSPRVLRAFEHAAAESNRCPDVRPDKTAEEMEVERLDQFFSAACRPGAWSINATVDANLKREYPKLCSLCGTNTTCGGYTLDMGPVVANVNNNNRHIQALECLRVNGNNSVAYVAWQHVREFFNIRNPAAATSYAVLCPDNSLRTLTTELLNNTTAPCAFVRQPWGTVVASAANAETIQQNMRIWWPNGTSPGNSQTWQGILFNGIIGGANAKVIFEDNLLTPANYTSAIRPVPGPDATAGCVAPRRWCTLSALENTKCLWTRGAAHSLGIQPPIACQQRSNVFDCLRDIKEDRADFLASSSNYGYLARQHYNLTPVKLLQNARNSAASFSRVAAFVKANQTEITRFENLRGRSACFPEYGGIAYVAFVRAAQERGVISASECDYAKAVGEFLGDSCAGGAIDASHSLSTSDYNATSLCALCKPAPSSVTIVGNYSTFTCDWNYSNSFFGNNGSMACLADPRSDVVFLEITNIQNHLTAAGLQANQLRALCRNNTLAAAAGVAVDEDCLLANVVDAEVITRREDPLRNALSVLLESLDAYFGYTAENGRQFINLELFSPFDGVSDLLFQDTAIGFTEPSYASANQEARNYIDLFSHLDSCNSANPGPAPGMAIRNMFSFVSLALSIVFVQFLV